MEEAAWAVVAANWMHGPELGPESTLKTYKLSKEVHQVADLMTPGCSLHNAQTILRLTAQWATMLRSPTLLRSMCLPLLYVAIT